MDISSFFSKQPTTFDVKKINGIPVYDVATLISMKERVPVRQGIPYNIIPVEELIDTTPLQSVFFSIDNIRILQNDIRAGVYKMSNNQYVISPQNETKLREIMYSFYLQYSNSNLPITSHIEHLNSLVCQFCVKQIYSEARSYLKYIYDQEHLPVPIMLPTDPDHIEGSNRFSKDISNRFITEQIKHPLRKN
jgi:hypothetical protein